MGPVATSRVDATPGFFARLAPLGSPPRIFGVAHLPPRDDPRETRWADSQRRWQRDASEDNAVHESRCAASAADQAMRVQFTGTVTTGACCAIPVSASDVSSSMKLKVPLERRSPLSIQNQRPR